MRRFFARLANLFRGRVAEREMAREIASHIALLQEDFERRGLPPHEAALAARRAYGGVEQSKELHRDARSLVFVEQLLKDVRYAWRNLLRNPGYTLVGAVALALGIGANATIFGVYNSLLLKQLPVADAGRVVRLRRWFQHGKRGDDQYNFSYPEYEHLRDHNGVFSALVAASDQIPALASIGDRADPEHIVGRAVSANYFADLGVKPRLGRAFRFEEDRSPGGDAIVVVSYRFWQRTLRGDPNIVGQTIKLNGIVYTMVGVAPPEFAGTDVFPTGSSFWAPLSMVGQLEPASDAKWRERFRDATYRRWQLLARLKTGVSRAQAQAGANLLIRQYLSGYREADRTIAVTLQGTSYFGNMDDVHGFRALVAAVWTVVSLVLLVACANVANMLLARGVSRQREIGVRLALGAGRGRVVRQLMMESILLALFGGAVGVLLSAWTSRLLWVSLIGILRGFHFNLLELDFTPDAHLLIYGIALSIVTAVFFGLLPALRFTRLDLHAAIKDEGPAFAGRRGRSRLRGLLMGAQVAVSVLLLMLSGELTTAHWEAKTSDPGFETRQTYLVIADEHGDYKAMNRRLRERLQTLPELSSVAIGDLPLMGHSVSCPMAVGKLNQETLASHESDAYFETIGIRLLRGRSFTRQEADRGAAVAVISESTAKRFWPGQDPLGKLFSLDLSLQGKFTPFEVVGIAKDVRFATLTEPDTLHVYLPTGDPQQDYLGGLFFRIRGNRDKALGAVQSAVESVDRSLLPGLSLVSMEEGPVAMQRNTARVMAAFSGVLTLLSLTLAAVGVYGVMAFLVSQRTREIGIRVALGATSRAVLRRIVIQGLRPVFLGMAVGFLAVATVDLVTSSDGVRDSMFVDPAAYGLLALVPAIAALASVIPARRALRVDPVEALRHE